MLSYRYMRMSMEGMRSGTGNLTPDDVFNLGYTVTPLEMTMDMHMVGVMYAPTDRLTLMGMGSFMDTSMEHRLNPAAPPMLGMVVGGDTFTTKSSGLGDIKLSALYSIQSTKKVRVHLALGLSLPTGSVSNKDQTPKPGMPPTFPVQQLPAPMQLGSGTYDLLPGVTWVRLFENTSIGLQAAGVLRLEDDNRRNYRLGHEGHLTAWGGWNLNPNVSLNAGLSYRSLGQLKGSQKGIGQMGPAGRSVTTAFGENYGGEKLEALFGVNFIGTSFILRDHRIALDLRIPVMQDLNGVQLETDLTLTVGWQRAW